MSMITSMEDTIILKSKRNTKKVLERARWLTAVEKSTIKGFLQVT